MAPTATIDAGHKSHAIDSGLPRVRGFDVEFANGGETLAMIPSRYPGSEAAEDGLVIVGRKTIWQPALGDAFEGLGQRVLATDQGDTPLLEVRSIQLQSAAE